MDSRMKGIVEISKMVTATDNFFNIKDAVVEKMLEVIYPAKACVNLFINDFENVHLVCSSTLEYIPKAYKKNEKGEYHIPLASYPPYIHEAIEKKEVIWVKDIYNDERAINEIPLAIHEGYRSRAVFPLISNNQVIGFMTSFFIEESSYYNDEDIDFISSVATMIGFSIDITTKKRDADLMMKKVRGSLNFINKASDELYKGLGLNKFLKLINKQVCNVTLSKSAFIMMKFGEGENLYESGFGEHIKLKEAALKIHKQFQKSSAKILNGQYYNKREMPDYIDLHEINTLLYHRLIKDGEEIGFIVVSNAPSYRADDLKILNIFAMQIIFAIERYENASKLIAHKVIEKELELVEKQQRIMMPKNHLKLSDSTQISYYYHPARNIGGDFCDIFFINKKRACIFIADVMGHGILSNYFVAMLKGAVKSSVKENVSAGEVLTKLNKTLFEDFNSMDAFTTGTLIFYDQDRNQINASNAGHHLPIGIKKENGRVVAEEILFDSGMPLGVLEDTRYTNQHYDVGKYDLLCLFTDGVIEAMNGLGEGFGIEALKHILIAHYQEDADQINESVQEALNLHTGKKQLLDDWILMIIKNNERTEIEYGV